MGADIKSLRIRIRSVDSTLHLTKAMGLVASSKIRRATKSMNQSRQYTAAMDELVAVLRAAPECERSPYMVSAGEGPRLIVIATQPFSSVTLSTTKPCARQASVTSARRSAMMPEASR